MTRYAQVHDIRDRISALHPDSCEDWFTVAGERVRPFRTESDELYAVRGRGGAPFTEWGASLGLTMADLAGPVEAPWIPHPLDAGTMWVDPMGGLSRITSTEEPRWDPRLCCSKHEAHDTGWRTSECRHCGAPMQFIDMAWEVVRG